MNINSFRDGLRRLGERFARAATEGLRHVAEVAQSQARNSGKFRNVTGRLYRSIVVVQRSRFRVSVEARAPYAKWVEEGTQPHVIEPVRRKALRFFVNGSLVFARRVNHPGSRPRYFMRDARTFVEGRARGIVTPHLNRAIKG